MVDPDSLKLESSQKLQKPLLYSHLSIYVIYEFLSLYFCYKLWKIITIKNKQVCPNLCSPANSLMLIQNTDANEKKTSTLYPKPSSCIYFKRCCCLS